MKKNIFLRALLSFKYLLVVSLILGFLLGFFITESIYNANFSHYTFEFETLNATEILNGKYFEDSYNKINNYNKYVDYYNEHNVNDPDYKKLSKITLTNEGSYYDLGNDIKYEEIDRTYDGENLKSIRYKGYVKLKYFSYSWLSSNKVSERTTRCKNTLTRLLTTSIPAYSYDNNGIVEAEAYSPLYKINFNSKSFIEEGVANSYIVGSITAVSLLVISYVGFVIFSYFHEYEEKEYDNKKIFKTPFHKEYWIDSLKCFKNIKDLAMLAMLFAAMIACKFIPIPSGFGNLGIGITFIFFAAIGMIYGPVAGFIIGIISDILGFFLFPSGYPFHILYTVQAALTGFTYGIAFYKTHITFERALFARIVVNLLLNSVLGTYAWGLVSYFSEFSQFESYFLILELPKNLVYLLPQSIVLFVVLKALEIPLSSLGIIYRPEKKEYIESEIDLDNNLNNDKINTENQEVETPLKTTNID